MFTNKTISELDKITADLEAGKIDFGEAITRTNTTFDQAVNESLRRQRAEMDAAFHAQLQEIEDQHRKETDAQLEAMFADSPELLERLRESLNKREV